MLVVLWLEEVATVEIAQRRKVVTSQQNLNYIQSVIRGKKGKYILDDIRDTLIIMQNKFRAVGNVHAQNLVLAISKSLVDQETGQRDFLLTGNEEFLEPFLTGRQALQALLFDLDVMVNRAFNVEETLEEINLVKVMSVQWIDTLLATKPIDEKNLLQLRQGLAIKKLTVLRAKLDKLANTFSQAQNIEGEYLVLSINRMLANIEIEQSDYLLTKGRDVKQSISNEKQLIMQKITALFELATTRFDKQLMLEHIALLNLKIAQWLNEAGLPEINLRRDMDIYGETMADVTVLLEGEKGKNLMDRIRHDLEQFIVFENDLIAQRRSLADKAIASTLSFFKIGVVLSFLFPLVAAVIVSRYIVGSFSELLTGMRQVIDGDFNSRITVNSKDEIGELANAFNKMVAELNCVQQKLIESSKMASLGQMAAGVAHELNQPLAAILLNSENLSLIMERKMYDHALKLSLVNIEQVERASKIINALRQFSREDADEQRVKSDLNALVNDMVTLVSNDFQLQGIDIMPILQPQLPEIYVSPVQVEQVISNLLINARDAIANSHVKEIQIRTYTENNLTILEIEDSGVGIAKKQLSKIFDPFYTTKDIGKGNGLGLSLSYAMLESNDATIRVESALNVGATFIISFHDHAGGTNE
jgi:signal transduction histidine kinase